MLSTPPTVVGGVNNKVPQLHATQSEPLDYSKYDVKVMKKCTIAGKLVASNKTSQ